MSGVERSPGIIEKTANISKKLDVIQMGSGIVIGGPLGFVLFSSGGLTYLIAHKVEQRQKRK